MDHPLFHLKNQFEQVANARGKSKIPLIKTFATNGLFNNELFLKTYDFVFNPHITTGIAKKKMSKKLTEKAVEMPVDILEVFRFVKENNTGSDRVVKSVQEWINSQPQETHKFLKDVFTNDLQIGASEKALNEALGYEYIPVWDVMLGKKWEQYMEKVTGKFFVTLKMDDHRCTIIYNDKKQQWELKARSGLLYEGIVEIEALLELLPKDMVYDGGLISANANQDSKARFRETGKILRTNGDKTGLMFYFYDMIPKDEFLKGKSKLGYEDRRKKLDEFFNKYGLSYSGLVSRVPTYYEGEDKAAIMPILDQVLADEFEGLMVNTANGKYETKRTNSLLKVKKFYTVDLRITGYKEYKHPGQLGAFKVDYKGHESFVGIGFKAHERVEFWEKRDEMVGKIIEVVYFQESENQNGGKSIRHGHFVGVRDDKLVESYD
jgi:DNA ligase 1